MTEKDEEWLLQISLLGKGPKEAGQLTTHTYFGIPRNVYRDIVNDLKDIENRLTSYKK